VNHVGGAEVEGFEFLPVTHRYRVSLAVDDDPRTEEADQVIVNAGFGPDESLCRELQEDEPQFFSLGQTPHAREPDFLLATGYRRVGDAIARLADEVCPSAS
jgi:hypothetical protein